MLATIPGRKRTKGKSLLKTIRYKRMGKCLRCGWCCEFENCGELQYVNGLAVCMIFGKLKRPEKCTRFPQAPPILTETCGFYFLDMWEDNRKVKYGKDL